MSVTLAFLIPTRNRHAELARWLPSVQRAASRVGAAIIVCDQSATAFAAPSNVQVLHRPDLGGLPAARNALLRATAADVVCFLDDDCEIAGDFAVHLLALAHAQPAVVGWGPVVETRDASTRRRHRLAHLGVFADPRRLLARRCDRPTAALFGCCFAVRRQVALGIGFDDRRPGYALGEDLDFCLRLGGPLRFVRDLRAVHHCAAAGRAQAYARGTMKARFLIWLARRHGGGNPATLLHLAVALVAAAAGGGREPAHWRGVLNGLGPMKHHGAGRAVAHAAANDSV